MQRIGALAVTSLLLLIAVVPAEAQQGHGNGRGRSEAHGNSGRQQGPPDWSQASARAEQEQARVRERQAEMAREREQAAAARQQKQAERARGQARAAEARQREQAKRARGQARAAEARGQAPMDRVPARVRAAQARQQLQLERIPQRQARLSAQEQQRLLWQQQQRADRYRSRLSEQVTLARQREAWLLQRHRTAQYRNQQRYLADLLRQQAYLSTARDYRSDPFFYTAPSYRYTLDGITRYTNLYGYNELRQAADYGYDEGYRAGVADREDGAAYGYGSAFAYSDASYGYYGNYVDLLDYSYYFRQAFRRGYDDGYYRGSQYGAASTGAGGIRALPVLGALLVAVLGLVAFR